MQKNPFGLKGDFITAPNISRMFSEMIAVWILGFWENLGTPKKINLVELGAGNGEMMKIFLETFKKFPAFLSSCNIFEMGFGTGLNAILTYEFSIKNKSTSFF